MNAHVQPSANVMSIKNVILALNHRRMLLPALQRKFVWKDEQICNLLDSIMKGYPVGTLIFWKISSDQANLYSFYQFNPHYDERELASQEALPQPVVLDSNKDLSIVLDGQQRITSLYIALQGYTTRQQPYKPNTYITREVYFNLRTHEYQNEIPPDAPQEPHAFKFMSSDEFNNTNTNELWYKVKDILDLNSIPMIAKYLHDNGWDHDELIYQNIMLLWAQFTQNEILNIYEYPTSNIDDVLEVFVRINSGGTKLSKTDLLFSAIVAQWPKARDNIDKLRQELKDDNAIEYSTDFIMRTCLFLIDANTKLNLSAFSDPQNVHNFSGNWDSIASSIRYICNLFKRMGIDISNLPSQNSIIPIIYHHYKSQTDYVTNPESINNIRNYIIISNLKNLFGRSQDTILDRIRKCIKSALDHQNNLFPPLDAFTHDGNPMLSIDESDIDAWLNLKKEETGTKFILNLLYPHFRYDCITTHIDHMHPFNAIKKITDIEIQTIDGLTSNSLRDRRSELKNICNNISNLQILTQEENEHKRDNKLVDWITDWNDRYPNQHIPYLPDTSYELSNIVAFTNARKELMRNKLIEILHIH